MRNLAAPRARHGDSKPVSVFGPFCENMIVIHKTIDLSKAFDKVNHYAVYLKLMNKIHSK